MDKQRAQITIAAFGNPKQHSLAARGMLARNQPEECAQLAPILELLGITNCCHQRRGGERTYAWHLGQTCTTLFALKLLGNLCLATCDSLFKRSQPLTHLT